LPLEADQSLGLKTRAAIVERMAQVQAGGLGDEHWAWFEQSTAGWPHWRLTSLSAWWRLWTVTMAVTMAQGVTEEETYCEGYNPCIALWA